MLAQPLADLNRMAHTLLGVVGVHQEYAVVRHRSRIRLERVQFLVEEHHPLAQMHLPKRP